MAIQMSNEFFLILDKIFVKFGENVSAIFVVTAFLTLCFIYHHRRRYLNSFIVFGFALISGFLYKGMIAWLHGLGGDSFLEASDFSLREGAVWLNSFLLALPHMLPSRNDVLFILGSAVIFSMPLFFLLRLLEYASHVMIFLLVVGHMNLAFAAYKGYKTGRAYVANLENLFAETVPKIGDALDIDMILYIGESTSSLNMSLYGYPLKTTPRLDSLEKLDSGFLKFNNIRSTQSHTSVSLQRALSIPSLVGTPYSLWGLGAIFNSVGVNAKLISAQPLTGSFASISKFIFDKTEYKLSSQERFGGNFILPSVKDHQLLPEVLASGGVTIFHSYAGHGPYLDLLDVQYSDEIELPIIDLPGLVGGRFSMLDAGIIQDIEAYNQAITYIDRNLAEVIYAVEKRSKPAVVIYFSDHGDSVFTKRGHESSRFIDEMTTVPFIIYFNHAYRNEYPTTYRKYQLAVQRSSFRFLDQIIPTILDILGVESKYSFDVPTMAETFAHPHPVIMERDVLQGLSSLDFRYDENKGFGQLKFFGGTPEPTLISIINEKFKDQNTICYHRADSFAKALRAASVAGCIEFDLVVEGGKFSIYHPPSVATGFQLEHMFQIASYHKNKLWIDSKNLHDPVACKALQIYLEKNHKRVGEVFVEFPAESIINIDQLISCGQSMRKIGVRTSYYVPTHWLLPCARDAAESKSSCVALNADLNIAIKSGIFSDLSFDFSGYAAIQKIESTKAFGWNTWAVKSRDFHKFPRGDFRYIIMDTSADPNTY